MKRWIIWRLLRKNPVERLGYGEEKLGYPSIKAHPFFADIDFETLHQRKPPIDPKRLRKSSARERLIQQLREQMRTPENERGNERIETEPVSSLESSLILTTDPDENVGTLRSDIPSIFGKQSDRKKSLFGNELER